MAHLSGGSQSPSQLRMTLLLYLYHPWSVETSCFTLWRPSRWKTSCDQSCGFNKPQPGKVWKLVFLHEASVVDFGISLQMVTVTLPLFKDGHHARRFVKHGILSVSSRNSFPSPIKFKDVIDGQKIICKTEDCQKFSGMEMGGQASWMDMSIKWHVWWVAMTRKQTHLGSQTHVACFHVSGRKRIYFHCMCSVQEKTRKHYCFVFFPNSFDQEPWSTEKDLKRNVKHLEFCQGQQLSWSHIICSTCVSAPLAKIRFMSQLIHPQMRISRSSAFP